MQVISNGNKPTILLAWLEINRTADTNDNCSNYFRWSAEHNFIFCKIPILYLIRQELMRQITSRLRQILMRGWSFFINGLNRLQFILLAAICAGVSIWLNTFKFLILSIQECCRILHVMTESIYVNLWVKFSVARTIIII